MTKEDMLIKSGLNWNVKSENIMTVGGIEIPDRIALVREDTNKVLGIHTNNYVPYQNEELLELLYSISRQSGLELHSGGSFKGGEMVWFQLKSNDLTLGNDRIEGYISGFNSFNGKTSLAFGTASLTVSCQNSFFRGYKMVDTKLRHSSMMKPRIDEILKKIDVILVEEQKQFNEIRKLSEVKMDDHVRELVRRKLFDLDKEEKPEDISTNKLNKMAKFDYALGIELRQKEDSLWGLFSGVTRYTTHHMKTGDNSEGKMFGRTGNLEREIYQDLLEIAG